YATDSFYNFLVLSRTDGHLEGELPMPQYTLSAHNQFTDRIFIGTPDGLILSMHETKYAEPYKHPQIPVEEKPAESGEPKGQPKRNFFGEVIEDEKEMTDETKPAEPQKPTFNFFDN